jgi:hypothetical protein
VQVTGDVVTIAVRLAFLFGLVCGACAPEPAVEALPVPLVAEDPVTINGAPFFRWYDNSILSFVAANAYHDLPSLEAKHNSKFEAFLLPTITPEEIENLMVLGPDGFEFAFRNVPSDDIVNGYILDERQPALWYHALLSEPLAEGRYTLRVRFKNGEEQQYSRVLVANDALVTFYLSHREQMQFRPRGGSVRGDAAVLEWSTLRELGGPDAYYNGWTSAGTEEGITGIDMRGDAIFFKAVLDPEAGKNVNTIQLGTWFDPLPRGPQTWQVEILDANVLDDINQIIFPPGHHFRVR